MYVFPSFVNLKNQLASELVDAVLPALLNEKVVSVLKFAEEITTHSPKSTLYLKPKVS